MGWNTLKRHFSAYSSTDQELIHRAYNLAVLCHKGQKRASGDPYITHPAAVACCVASIGMDARTIAAAFLHDTIDDCNMPPERIKNACGSEVLSLVKGVAQLGHIRYTTAQRKVEALRKMFLAVAEDIRVVIIKLYDRLHNMRTIGSLSPAKQKRIARETLELYAPIAHRLGIWELKGELEDLAFPIMRPREYAKLLNAAGERIAERTHYLNRLIPVLKKELKKDNITVLDIHARAKRYYSLWKKLLKHDNDINAIYDLVATRIIVPSVEDCYKTLGTVHAMWKPLPDRIKDYIALPKLNRYKSLHTTVRALDNKIIEIQIRTRAMHDEAELGIAAHWAYDAAGKSSNAKPCREDINFVRRLREWQKMGEAKWGEESAETLKIDFLKDRIFVLTPKGEVIDLPEGSTPIDFAYHVHTEIGDCMAGAKVNGKMAAFSHKLLSGDSVEILTQKNRRPSPDWLGMAQTSIARSHIRSALKRAGMRLPKAQKVKTRPATVTLSIRSGNRVGMLKDLTTIFTNEHINIDDTNVQEDNQHYHIITFRFSCRNNKKLDRLMKRVRAIKGVRAAHKGANATLQNAQDRR